MVCERIKPFRKPRLTRCQAALCEKYRERDPAAADQLAGDRLRDFAIYGLFCLAARKYTFLDEESLQGEVFLREVFCIFDADVPIVPGLPLIAGLGFLAVGIG